MKMELGGGGGVNGRIKLLYQLHVHCEAANRSPLKSFKHQRVKPTAGENNTFAAALASQL